MDSISKVRIVFTDILPSLDAVLLSPLADLGRILLNSLTGVLLRMSPSTLPFSLFLSVFSQRDFLEIELSPDVVHLPAVRVQVLLSDHEWRIKELCDVNNIPAAPSPCCLVCVPVLTPDMRDCHRVRGGKKKIDVCYIMTKLHQMITIWGKLHNY